MHSRYFLHRTPSEPRASVGPTASDRVLPVGFVDVGDALPVSDDERRRGPVGFAPSEPVFVTELSFRRTPRPRPAVVRAASEPSSSDPGLSLGHAGWRPAAHPVDDVPETDVVDGAGEPTEQRAQERVPFHKRELTFRRRPTAVLGEASSQPAHDHELDPVAEVEQPAESTPGEERVPFYKREISLRRRKRGAGGDEDVVLGSSVEPDDPERDDTADAPPFDEPSLPFGFAVPAGEEEPVADDVDDEPSEPMAVEPAHDDETDDEDELPVEVVADATDEPAEIDGDPSGAGDDLAANGAEPQAEAEAESTAEDADTWDTSHVERNGDELAAELDEPDHEADGVVERVRAYLSVEQDETEGGFEGEDDVFDALDVDDDPSDLSELAPVEVISEAVSEPFDFGAVLDDGFDELDEYGVPLAPDKKEKRKRAKRSKEKTPKAARSSAAKGGRGGRRVVGLKIGASQLAAAVVTRQDGHDQLVQLARTPLDAGIVVDGEVRDADALETALRGFFEEHKLPRRDVRFGIASNRVGVRTVDLSGIDEADRFDNAVRFKAHEVLPVSFSESVLDYRVVEERIAENGDVTKRVLLAVAPKDQVVPFANACLGAGLRLAGVDLEALGLLRTFVPPQPPGTRLATDTATVVVAIGHESTTLLVAGGGLCEFTRLFDWGSLALQQGIAQELDVHLPEAATILHGLSLSGPGRGTIDEDMRQRALEAVRTRLTPFARELVSSLQFYQSQHGSLGIGEIVITGGASHLEGLADALHQMIGVSVRVGDPLQRLALSFPVDPEYEALIGSFAVPVGLAIEDDQSRGVNLMPTELRRERRTKTNPLLVAIPVAAVVPLAAMGFMFTKASGELSTQKDSLANVQAQIDALPEPTRPEIDPALASVQQQRAAALARVLGGRLAWDRVLGDLSRVLPSNVWLTSLSAQLPVATTAGAAVPAGVGATAAAPIPTGVTIQGYTYSVPDVARLLGRLGTLPSLRNVTLSATERKDIGKRPAISFTILADIASNGGAQ
jgi:type IV pilus assembly protein PilM